MLAVRASRSFDGERLIQGDVSVLIGEQGRIAGVESGWPALPEGVVIAEFPGATVLPGLIDMHVHLCADSQDGALDRIATSSDGQLSDVIEQALSRQLAAGVTTVRDLGDRQWTVLARRDDASRKANGSAAPTLLASGPPITSVRGHCWFMGGEAKGEEQLRAAVSERADRRVDVVKIMASGGANTPGTDVLACQFLLEEVRLVVDEAHAAGLPVTAHAHGLPAVELALQAGVDGIEHCSCLTPSGIELSDQLLESLAASRIVVCPTLGKTLGAVPPPGVRAMMQRTGLTWEARQTQFARMHRAGVVLVSGSDGGISAGKPHGILPAAVADLVAGGVPNTQALASATSVAAAASGLGERKGRLRTGYDGDLLVVDGDPIADIDALGRIAAVMVMGKTVAA